jgi:hypothetical protein
MMEALMSPKLAASGLSHIWADGEHLWPLR